jgi:hypothetical protein
MPPKKVAADKGPICGVLQFSGARQGLEIYLCAPKKVAAHKGPICGVLQFLGARQVQEIYLCATKKVAADKRLSVCPSSFG